MFPVAVAQQVDNLCLYGHIQGCTGLIRHQQRRLHGKGPGNGNSLPLSAGQLRGIFVQVAGVHTHILQLELCFRPECASRRLDVVNGHRLRNNICHGHTPVQAGGRVLEDQLPLDFQKLVIFAEGFFVADVDAIKEDLACGGLVDIHNAPGNGGFAGAGFSHKAEDLAFFHLEGYIVHRFDHGVFAQFEYMGKVLHIKEYFRHCASLPWVILFLALWGQEARLPHCGCR